MKSLKKWREEQGLSLNELSRKCGLSPQTLHNLETKVKDPSWSTAKKLIAAGVPESVIEEGMKE